MINEDIQNTLVINAQTSAQRNETSSGVFNCGGTGDADFTIRQSASSACSLYFLYNNSEWDRDRIADVQMDLIADDTAFCSNPFNFRVSPANSTNSTGQVWNASQIPDTDTQFSGHYPEDLPQAGGFNASSDFISCTDNQGQIDLNITPSFSINYNRHLQDLFTIKLGIPFSEDAQLNGIQNRIAALPGINLTVFEKSFRTIRLDATNTRYILYDFEGDQFLFTNLSTIFDDPTAENLEDVFDFVYDTTDNILKPGSSIGSLASPAGGDLEPSAVIQDTACSFFTYSSDPIESLNAGGEFEKICFQLQDQHDGRPFFGVLRLFNSTCPNIFGCAGGVGNTGRDVGLFLSFVSASSFQVEFTSSTPQNPQEGDDVSIKFTATKNSTGFVRYRTAPSDSNFSNLSVFSPFFTLNDTLPLKILHDIRIPNVQQDTFYQFFVFVEDNQSNIATDNNTNLFFNFTVGARGIFREGNETAIVPEAIDRLADILGLDFTIVTYMFGLMLLIPAVAISFMAGGIKLGFAGLSGGICCFSLIGILPIYLLLPFLALAALIIASIVKKGI